MVRYKVPSATERGLAAEEGVVVLFTRVVSYVVRAVAGGRSDKTRRLLCSLLFVPFRLLAKST